MAITIYTTSSYNVNIKLGRARGQDQKPAFLNPIVPALKRASNSFPFGMRGGLSSDHTWALHPVNHAIYTQPPNLLQSQERFARGKTPPSLWGNILIYLSSPSRPLLLSDTICQWVFMARPPAASETLHHPPVEHRRGAFAASETFLSSHIFNLQLIIAVSCPGSLAS